MDVMQKYLKVQYFYILEFLDIWMTMIENGFYQNGVSRVESRDLSNKVSNLSLYEYK